MSILQIQSEVQTPQWLFGGTTATLRIYASQSFYGADGTQVTQGQVGSPNWYQEYTCTISGGYVTIPQVELQSTTDSTVPNATYTAVFFDSAGRQRNIKLGNFWVDTEYFQSSPFYAVEFADAGTANINGTYTYRGQTGGYAYYNLLGESNSTTLSVIKNNGSLWIVTDSAGTTKYTSAAQTDNPYDGVWINAGGTLPVPTVSQSSTYVSGTWEQVTLSNQGVSAIPIAWAGPFWSIPQTKEYVNSLVGDGTTPFASVTVEGKTALDTNPTLSTDPVAVAVNSNRIEKNLSSDYGNDIDTALSNILTDNVTLVIKNAATVNTNTVIPSNIVLQFLDEGVITVVNANLTIGQMIDPGNRQVFVLSGGSNVLFDVGAVDAINIAWFVATPGLCTTAITNALASCTANGGGTLFFPEGDWTTAGAHALVDNTTIIGSGKNTTLTATGNATGIFTHGANVYDVLIKDLTLDGGGFTIAAYLCSAANGDGSAGNLRFENVNLQNAEYGLRIYDTGSTEWQMAQISFDAKCRISNNTYGIWCNTTNNVGQCDAFFEVASDQWAGYFTNGGQWTFTGEFAGDNTVTGTNQIETQTIVGNVTVAGVATSVVTAPGMVGTPKSVSVNVDTSMTTGTLIATAFREALGNDPSVTTFFHIGGTGADVQLIALTPAANSGINFTINTGTATGITNSATSANTVAGVAPTGQPPRGFYISGAHGVFSFIGSVDEGFSEFLVNEASDLSSMFSFHGATIQSPISLNQSCQITTVGCSIIDRSIRDDASSGSQYTSVGDVIPLQSYLGGAFRTLSVRKTNNFSGANSSGSSSVALDVNTAQNRIFAQYPATFYENENFLNSDRGVVEAMSSNDPAPSMVRVGRCTSTGEPLFYYDIYRDYTTGWLNFVGSQTDFPSAISYVFDASVYVPDEAYSSVTWNANLTIPTKNAIRDVIVTLATLAGATFTGDVIVPDEAYSNAWNGVLEVPTKNAVYDALGDITAAGRALLDDANAAAQLVTLGLNATATEINQLNDVSAYQESIVAAGALSITKVYSGLSLGAAGAVTLAAPDATMLGQQKMIEMIVDNGDVTLSLANCEGGSAATTCTWTAVGQKLIVMAGASKWTIIKEFGVTVT